jgi:ribose transport system ATP-binding protein
MSLAVRHLTKRFGGVTVLESVDLTVANGEIHALLGANGAGKSTLIKCVSGAIAPDAGEIEIGGRRFHSLTPREAWHSGLAVIYQELSVISTLDLVDNIFLGDERRKGFLLRKRAERREAHDWLARLGLEHLSTRTPLARLGNAELQIVEIVKALRKEPKVLILDEPTAALTETETQRLGAHMRTLKEQGLPLLFVTHRLAEVFDFADHVTVLRGGKVVVSARVSDVSRRDLVQAIAGGAADRGPAGPVGEREADETPLLGVQGLLAGGIGPLDLAVARGAILGVFGLVGSGRTELLESLFGARPRTGGRISIDGRHIRLHDPTDAVAAGIALVPSDRLRKGIFPTLRASDNMLFASFGRYARRGIVRRRRLERRGFRTAAAQLDLQPPRPDLEGRRFSGGNQQKLVLGRWLQLRQQCKLLLLDEPTQGVDVGARSELYAAMREFTQDGGSVILTSSEPEELLEVADSVLVLSRGRVAGMLAQKSELSETRMLELAHAIDEDEPAGLDRERTGE